MSLRPLGRSPLSIAPLAFGGNVFGWSADEKRAFELLDAFVDAGFNLIDTADVYPAWVPGNRGGESEAIIGRWLRSRPGVREKVLIATKVAKWAEQPGLSPVNIRQAVDGSLRRLQVDCIDLYQAHEDDASVPLAETLGAFGRLIEQGKVRVIGASNYGADRFAEALAVSAREGLPRYESLQPQYNLLERDYERELEPLVRREQVGVLCYYALASGFLTGKYRSEADLGKSPARRGAAARYLADPRGPRVLGALDEVAAAHRATPAQVALAWLMARPGITAPIASATSVAQLQELLGAARLVLGADELGALGRAGT